MRDVLTSVDSQYKAILDVEPEAKHMGNLVFRLRISAFRSGCMSVSA